MKTIEDLQMDSLTTFSDKLMNGFEAKLKECITAWGIDENNHEEIKDRCSLIYYNNSLNLNEFKIDGYIVMMFSDWEFDTANELSDVNYIIKSSCKCSEILTPKDYNLCER
jgi:hypothetical protein